MNPESCGQENTQWNNYTRSVYLKHCPLLPLKIENSHILSQFLWIINKRYDHRLEYPDFKGSCNNGDGKQRNVDVLETLLNPEPAKIIILVDRRSTNNEVAKAVSDVVLNLLHSFSPQGNLIN